MSSIFRGYPSASFSGTHLTKASLYEDIFQQLFTGNPKKGKLASHCKLEEGDCLSK